MNKKTFVFCIVFLAGKLALSALDAGRQVCFFSTQTDDQENATIKLTENLFYSQLASENVQLTDMRPAKLSERIPDSVTGNKNAVLFALALNETGNGWECTIILENPVTRKNTTVTHTYEGYYKILMDAKNSLEEAFAAYDSMERSGKIAGKDNRSSGNATASADISLENLAGTWKGEQLIDKVVILRSGRGFVIFNNGASMNISLSLSNNTLTATQTGRPNASFFPDLPREIALQAAPGAEPVAWKMTVENNDTLKGTKTTLMPKESPADNETPYERRSISVTWVRL